MFKISIPKPCFEGWDNMTPNEQGRYCNACAKTVVDFSVLSDEAVQQYFINNYNQQICGHFKNTQLQRITIDLPQNIFRLQLPFWKKFLVAFLICFGGSFFLIDTTMAGNRFMQGNVIQQTGLNIYTIIKSDKQKSVSLKKKKHRKKKKPDILFTFDFPVLLGLTTICPTPTITENIVLGDIKIDKTQPSVFDTPDYAKEKKGTNTGTSVKNNTAANNPDKAPSPKLPEQTNVAFILPAASRLKNPLSKKKKA
jgi:hypothetical protein